MADLFERLFPDDPREPNIPIHTFRAALGDYAAGHTTRNEIVTFWELGDEAQIDLDVLLTTIDTMTAIQKVSFLLQLHDVLMIAETGTKYTTKQAFRERLGL